MPRHGGARLEAPRLRPEGGALLSLEAVRSLLAAPGLPPALAPALAVLAASKGELSRAQVAESGALQAVVESLDIDYSEGNVLSTELKEARLRLLKVKLLTNLSTAALNDSSKPEVPRLIVSCCCRLLCRAVGAGRPALRPEERVAGLGLLAALLCRAQAAVQERLPELLGYLAVLAGLHRAGREQGCSLVPTNLPHLHFTRTSNSDPEQKDLSCPETSESELSDNELIADGEYRQARVEALVQRDALTCLGLVAKRFPKKDVVSFWFLFLSADSFSPLSGSLMDLMEHQNKRVRYQTLAILTDFLGHSGQFLALAQHQAKATSYTSLSAGLASALMTLHRLLLARLRDPLGPTETVALLKMVAALAENCSYPRLEPGLLERVILGCLAVARGERNPVIQVACLSVFASLCLHCATEPAVVSSGHEVFGFMAARARPDLASPAPDNNVRYMALQALAGLTAVDLQIFLRQAAEVKRLIDSSLLDPDPSIVLHAFRFIKNFARSLTALVEIELKNAGNEAPRNKNMAVSFWMDFLKPSNFDLLDKYPNANIKSAFCDCLAEMGGLLFTELPEAGKMVCITYVLGQCIATEHDRESSPVTPERLIQDRAALSSCLRTLGIFVMFPAYLTDTAFHIDVADAVLPHLPAEEQRRSATGAPDPNNKAVRVSASWALANLTDTLLQAERERRGDMAEEDAFPVRLARSVLQRSVVAALDTASAVNTKSNAVRCVGNMLFYLTRDRLGSEQEFDSLMASGTQCLVTNIRSGKIMKIRWNACYAASNVLRKEGLEAAYGWKQDLLDCLLDTVVHFNNFKVRINAAVALGSVAHRGTLGPGGLQSAVAALLASLEDSQGGEVLGEWQHQENLVSQLSCSLCSLIALAATSQELAGLAGQLAEQWDLVTSALTQSVKRISPEKTSSFLAASQSADRLGRDSAKEEVVALAELLTECANNY
jgi:hypothetical protein